MVIWPEAGASLNLPIPEFSLPTPRNASWFAAFSVMLAGIVAIVSSSGLLAGVPASRRAALVQAGTTCLTPLAALALAWLRLQFDVSASLFAAIAGLLAFAFMAAATVLRPRPDDAAWIGLGCFAAAAPDRAPGVTESRMGMRRAAFPDALQSRLHRFDSGRRLVRNLSHLRNP